MYVFVSKATGEVMRYQDMMAEFFLLYDGGDPTNTVSWSEYYEAVLVPPDFWD